jgi:hypothetical protein
MGAYHGNMFPIPLLFIPMAVFEFAQVKIAPFGLAEKVSGIIIEPEHTEISARFLMVKGG